MSFFQKINSRVAMIIRTLRVFNTFVFLNSCFQAIWMAKILKNAIILEKNKVDNVIDSDSFSYY